MFHGNCMAALRGSLGAGEQQGRRNCDGREYANDDNHGQRISTIRELHFNNLQFKSGNNNHSMYADGLGR